MRNQKRTTPRHLPTKTFKTDERVTFISSQRKRHAPHRGLKVRRAAGFSTVQKQKGNSAVWGRNLQAHEYHT